MSRHPQVCLALLERFGLRVGQYQLGRTKVFFRPGVLGLVEDRCACRRVVACRWGCPGASMRCSAQRTLCAWMGPRCAAC